MFMFICRLSQKIKKSNKELEFTKLEFHITRNSSLVSSSTAEKKITSILFTNNSSLVCSSIVLHGTRVYQARVPHYFLLIAQIPGQQRHGGMKLGTRVY